MHMVDYLTHEAPRGWKCYLAYDAEVAFNTVTAVVQGRSDNPLVVQSMEKMYEDFQKNRGENHRKEIELLKEFCKWLDSQGFPIGTDSPVEHAIDEFMKQRDGD